MRIVVQNFILAVSEQNNSVTFTLKTIFIRRNAVYGKQFWAGTRFLSVSKFFFFFFKFLTNCVDKENTNGQIFFKCVYNNID